MWRSVKTVGRASAAVVARTPTFGAVGAIGRRWRSEPAELPESEELRPLSELPGLPMSPLLGSSRHILDVYPAEEVAAKGYTAMTAGPMNRPYQFYSNLWKMDGVDELAQFGIAGFGKGVSGRILATRSPELFQKVLRAEGQYPSGGIETQWFMKEYFSRNDMPTSQKFWSRGEGWQTIRRLIQHQLLLPGAAKSYGDAIGAAVEIASKGAPTCGTPDKFHGYLMRASFDMFCAAFHGRLTKCAGADGDEGSRADPLDLAFCQAASNVLTANMPLFLQPKEVVLNHLVPGSLITTPLFNAFCKDLDFCYSRGADVIQSFKDRMDRNTLTPYEKASYLHATLTQHESGSDLSVPELAEILSALLIASVDTTAAYTQWVVTALAIHQDAQERVHTEIVDTLGDAPLSTEMLQQPNWLPLLRAVRRETHRMRPVFNGMLKWTATPLELCGYDVPAGEMVICDIWTPQNDPQILPDAAEFKPERWTDAAVEARKGTPAELVDHPLFRGPFSSGARQCPASRVATNEVLFMAAQLVRDYRLRLADPSITSLHDVDYEMKLTMQPILPEIIFEPRK
eukprot:m.45963 g.45963  ORF g.45963 m.45963 type:complete len:570 (+) comp8702_c0_seq1:69-1778(+)